MLLQGKTRFAVGKYDCGVAKSCDNIAYSLEMNKDRNIFHIYDNIENKTN